MPRKPTLPYVGPRAFERDDQIVFFGREREVSETHSLIIAEPVVLLYATSGAGKTSMINAGLIPTLEQDYEVLSMGRLRSISEEVKPPPNIGNAYIFNALAKLEKEAADKWVPDQAPRQRIRRDGPSSGEETQRGPTDSSASQTTPLSLSQFLAIRRPVLQNDLALPRLIIFDQFEEIFSAAHDPWIEHRTDFFSQVRDALVNHPQLRILFALREDYVAHLDRYADLMSGGLRTRYRMEPLRPAAALTAIVEPPRRTSTVTFATGVAEKLVEDLLQLRVDTGLGTSESVRGEFVDPVQLQVVCQTLWSELPPGTEQITDKLLPDVDQALSRFYDAAIRSAAEKSGTGERELRIWFEKVFITSGWTRNFLYRTPTSSAGISNDALDELVSRHLIKPEVRAGARWYELNHDRFIKPIIESNKAFLLKISGPLEQDFRETANQALAHATEAQWTSRPAEAISFTERALELYRAHGDGPGAANALIKLGEIRRGSSQFGEALDALKQARDIYATIHDGGREANTIGAIADVYEDMGNDREALALHQEALGIYSQRQDLPQVASRLTSIAVLVDRRGEHQEALKHLGEALTIYRMTHDRQQEANTLWNIAAVYYQLDDLPQSLQLYEQTMSIQVDLQDRWGEANTRRDMGFVLAKMGNYAGALEVQQQALKIYREIDDRAGEAAILTSIARLEAEHGKLSHSYDLDQQALEIFRDLGYQREQANVLAEIASVTVRLGDHARALSYQQEALAIDRALGDRWGEANTLREIGQVYEVRGEYEQAVDFQRQALQLYQAIGDAAGAETTAARLAQLDAAHGQASDAMGVKG